MGPGTTSTQLIESDARTSETTPSADGADNPTEVVITDRDENSRDETVTAPEARTGLTDRRAVFAALGAGLVAAACVPAAETPAAPPPALNSGTPVAPTSIEFARLLGGRATHGVTGAVVAKIQAMGVNAWLEEQLAPGALPDATGRLGAFNTLRQNNWQNEAVRATDQDNLFYQLDHATLLRAVYSERQLYEVMCDFWTNHLNIWRSADWLTQLKTVDNEQVVRGNALGKFGDLLMASAKSPAMLVYLDNYQSRGEPGQQVNENYGRELCELHTLGIVNGQQVYGENDILGVAKVLSGWNINWADGDSKFTFVFADWNHCREAVSILGGQWSCPARPTWVDYSRNGLADGESLIRFLARHSSTARHICYKLVRRFVSDDPPMGLVDRLAGVYTANDTAIVPVLRELFRSPEFAASSGLKVKRPIDWLYSSLRVTGAQIHDAPRGQASARLRSAASALGQANFERVSPDGFPEKAKYWVGADGLLKRWEYGAKISRNQITDANAAEKVVVDPVALVPQPVPPTNAGLITSLASDRLQIAISAGDANAICTALRIDPAGPSAALATNVVNLQATIGLLLAHPTFQRR